MYVLYGVENVFDTALQTSDFSDYTLYKGIQMVYWFLYILSK